jgi:hypothetical protein
MWEALMFVEHFLYSEPLSKTQRGL